MVRRILLGVFILFVAMIFLIFIFIALVAGVIATRLRAWEIQL